MANNYLSFEEIELRRKYTREIRESLEKNNLNYWWISPSVKTNEIFISPKPKEDREWQWGDLPTISRISIQIKDGKPSLGISGYHPFQVEITKKKFIEEKKYAYHDKGCDKDGKPTIGRWWLTKTLNNLESLAGELKSIEPLLFEKNGIPKQ